MSYNPQIHNRHSIRLKGYDYSRAGFYFITICTQDREHLFGEIKNGIMNLNSAGKMVENVWNEIPEFYPGFKLHPFIVMPNHFHAIIEIKNINNENSKNICEYDNSQNRGEHGDSPRRNQISIPELIQRYKSLTTTKYIKAVKTGEFPRFNKRVWQRNYYEHIVRNEAAYLRISAYIKNNPKNWKEDRDSSDNKKYKKIDNI